MKIKSLLLGSAAASMLAATGAQAADPIVYVEPEPMEYVRICDVYGSGFFYIPGTETCLQVSGYVRYEIRFGGGDVVDALGDSDGDGPLGPWVDTYRKHLEARVNFDARSETEWGTLRSYIRIQASDYTAPNVDLGAAFDQAFIQLGGLTMGYTESVFSEGLTGVGGTHSMNGGFDSISFNATSIAAGLPVPHSGSRSYGYNQRMRISYNFAANGFFGGISLEDDANLEIFDEADDSNNYMPDVVARLGFTQAWGGVYGNLGYDESASEFAVRIGGELNVGTAGNLRVYGLYASGVNSYWSNADWSVAASYQHTFNPAFFAHVGAQYWDDVAFFDGTSAWGVEAGVGWNVARGFQVRAEAQYVSYDTPAFGIGDALFDDPDTYSGRIRFIRTF